MKLCWQIQLEFQIICILRLTFQVLVQKTMHPTLDGRLFVSGKRSGRTQLRALEIVQYPSPIKPETENVTINDNLGQFSNSSFHANIPFY